MRSTTNAMVERRCARLVNDFRSQGWPMIRFRSIAMLFTFCYTYKSADPANTLCPPRDHARMINQRNIGDCKIGKPRHRRLVTPTKSKPHATCSWLERPYFIE
jgi:hypothetical protein